MNLFLALLLSALQLHVSDRIESLRLLLKDQNGAVVREVAAPEAGEYVVDDVEPGQYTLQAIAQNQTLTTITDIEVSSEKDVVLKIELSKASKNAEAQPTVGTQRNLNIVINLIDNNALNERLGREGASIARLSDFTAVKSNYAAEFGGLGRNIDILASDRGSAYHGEVYDMMQNNVFNARTFFQVGPVQKTHRNQYGMNFGGPLVRDKLSLFITAEETRQSGFVNGNALVLQPNERTPTATDPAAVALISNWIAAYPALAPNRTEIDPRLLNMNAIQTIRDSGGTVRVDWNASGSERVALRYLLRDTFINAFQFVGGQNPNQRFRPQDLTISLEQRLSSRSVLRLGFNYLRQNSNLYSAAGSVGPTIWMTKQLEDLGPKKQFPILRIRNDFEYLALGSQSLDRHQLDWGSEIRRYQMNDIQSNEARGGFWFCSNYGRSGVENLLAGTPCQYNVVLGNLYRGFRNTDLNFFVNDLWKVRPNLQLNLGLRYEIAGAPHEVNHLTEIPYKTDRNNLGPRIGFVYSPGSLTVRGGYGIAFGRIFPAAYGWARFNPPQVIRLNIPNADLLNPLKDYHPVPGEVPRSALNELDPNLVVPYSQQYTLELERQLGKGFLVRGSYIGSRTWKIIESAYGNRGARPAGVPVTSETLNDRRPDQRYYSVIELTSMGRAYFDAGRFSIEKTAGRIILNAAYTWSKAMDTGAQFSSTKVNDDEVKSQAEGNIIQDLKAVSLLDATHGLVISYSYQLPGFWLRGWSVSGTTLLRSGTPFNVEVGTDGPPLGNADGDGQDRPSLLDPSILGRTINNPDTSQSILRRSAFSTEDTFLKGRGNIARNAFRKDGIANFNLALARSFLFPEHGNVGVTIRAEVLNLMNHPQFDAPQLYVASPSFGRITNTLNNGRVLQFALGVKF